MMHEQRKMGDTEKRSGRARRGALAFVLGLLCLLAAAATANAYVTQTTHTSLADFELGAFTYTGLVDLPGVESVQLMPMGLSQEDGGWTLSNRTLPEALVNLVAVAGDGRIYVAGGREWDLSLNDQSWVTAVGPDGSLGEWLPQASMPEGRTSAGFALHELNPTNSMLYVVGGLVPDPDGGIIPRPILTDTIVRAQIDRGTGALTGWEEETERLPVPIQNPSVVVHDSSLYVIGGWDKAPAGGEVYNKVLRASIEADGSLGAFAETSPLSETGLYYGLALVYEGDTTDTVYYMGGIKNGTDEPTAMVQFADFLPSGDLTTWSSPSEGNLPRTLYGHSGVYLGDAFEHGELLLTGGMDNYLSGVITETEAISSVVKVALVDPASSFRLYDWCQGASEEECDIGAWQTGRLLDDNVAEDGRRAFHVTVASGDYAYVLGGQGLSQDGKQLEVEDTIFVGKVGNVEAMYTPKGQYDSVEIDLLRPSTLLQLTWDASISSVDPMTLTMEYRHRTGGGGWSDWSAPVPSIDGTNAISITSQSSHPEDIRYFQYRAKLATLSPVLSPRLNSVQVFYDVPDPDLAVIKDTGYVTSVPLGSNLAYYIHYANNGGWDAENAVLTEVLPDNTTFAGTAGWEQVGTSNIYTYQLGDVPWGEGGTVPFEITVDSEVPPGTEYINNRVEIDYPQMVDIWDNAIIDPIMDDNVYELSTELNLERQVDLVPIDLVWNPVAPEPGEWPEFCVTVVNSSTVHAIPPLEQLVFWVELYIKPAPSDPPVWASEHDWGWCLGDECPIQRDEYTADISQLLAGASREVCFQPQVPEDPLALDYPALGSYDVYVQVDVAFGLASPTYGCFLEANEENNILHRTLLVGASGYFLPLVSKGAP